MEVRCGCEFVRDLKPNWLDMYEMVREMHGVMVDPSSIAETVPMVMDVLGRLRVAAMPDAEGEGPVPLPCGECAESPNWTSHGWLCPTKGCKGAELPDHLRRAEEWDAMWTVTGEDA